jgi:hypothetical protein
LQNNEADNLRAEQELFRLWNIRFQDWLTPYEVMYLKQQEAAAKEAECNSK